MGGRAARPFFLVHEVASSRPYLMKEALRSSHQRAPHHSARGRRVFSLTKPARGLPHIRAARQSDKSPPTVYDILAETRGLYRAAGVRRGTLLSFLDWRNRYGEAAPSVPPHPADVKAAALPCLTSVESSRRAARSATGRSRPTSRGPINTVAAAEFLLQLFVESTARVGRPGNYQHIGRPVNSVLNG